MPNQRTKLHIFKIKQIEVWCEKTVDVKANCVTKFNDYEFVKLNIDIDHISIRKIQKCGAEVFFFPTKFQTACFGHGVISNQHPSLFKIFISIDNREIGKEGMC